MIESVLQAGELQQIKKICLQFDHLNKVTTYVMNLMAKKDAAIGFQLQEESKMASTAAETEKWTKILD